MQMEKIMSSKLKNKVFCFPVLLVLINISLSYCSSQVESKLTVISPENYSGICIIEFTNNDFIVDSAVVFLDKNGLGKINSKFRNFNKSKNIFFLRYSKDSVLTPINNFRENINYSNSKEIYFQHGLTIGQNGKTYLLFRIGRAKYLKSKFDINDPIIDDKINSIELLDK